MKNKKRKIVSVTRWQIGPWGSEMVVVKWNRTKQTATMKVDGTIIGMATGKSAEEFFNKYGLLNH